MKAVLLSIADGYHFVKCAVVSFNFKKNTFSRSEKKSDNI